MLGHFQHWLRPEPTVDEGRWVVLDVESSGLDARHDRLLVITAIAVHIRPLRPLIALGDSFEVLLRQPGAAAPPDKSNILLHGIGVGAQVAGTAALPALSAFAEFLGASPLIAFHAAFDRTLIQRACRAELGRVLPNPWLDLEPLAAVLFPKVRARSLDEWMSRFDIQCAVRHQAAADTLATAELLLKMWSALLRELPRPAFAAVMSLAAQRRWLQR